MMLRRRFGPNDLFEISYEEIRFIWEFLWLRLLKILVSLRIPARKEYKGYMDTYNSGSVMPRMTTLTVLTTLLWGRTTKHTA